MRGSFTNLIRSVVCGLMILGASVAVFAQFKAGLQGTITDTTGGLVAGATVTLTNTETNKSTNTVSSDEGFYRFNGLAPGKYSVTVTQANFKKKVVENINVTGEIVQGLDVAIEAGGVNETVTITDEQPPLRTEDANIDKTLTTREIQSLPQVGRDPYELARLTPGIFGDGARSGNGGAVNLPNTAGPGGSNNSIFQTENQVPISANGQRISANSYQIDGVSVDSQTWGGAAVVTPSQESVKEVKVSSSTYSAQDGRNSGAVVKVISQNGTNIYHGSAFLKYDEPGLNAFNKYSAPTRINDKSRQYGGSLGGRLIRDKLFFFFTYEGYKTSSNNTVDNWIETSQYRQVVSAARPGSIVAKFFADPGIAPRVVQTLSRNCADFGLSAANCHEVAGGLDLGSPLGTRGQYITDFSPGIGGGFDGSPDVQFARLAVPTAFHGNQYNPRIDWNATEKDSVAFTAFFTPTKNQGSDAAGRSRPMEDISSTRFNWATSVIYRRSISATLFNEARVNFTHWGYNEVDSNPDVNFGLPRIEIEGYSIDRIRFGADRSESTPGVFSESTFHIGDTLTWTKGTHVFNFGIDIGRDKNANSIIGGSRPLYTFEGLWSFANDTPLFEAVNLDPTTGAPAGGKRDYRSGDYSFFVQDDWKLRPNLTVNLGLRYELFTPLKDKSNHKVI